VDQEGNMTERQRQRLLREIARIREGTYRAGFERGFDTAVSGEPLEVDLSLWRKVPLTRSPSPHGGRATSAEDRLLDDFPSLPAVLATVLDD
jgi:hypothetical protein